MTTLLTEIAQNAANAPDTVAVSDQDRTWTYGQLWATAGAIANGIHARQIGRHQRILLALPPGGRWVASLLAIWRTGGVAVPLDLDQPPARLSALAAQCRAALALTKTGQPPGWAPALTSMTTTLAGLTDDDQPPRAPAGQVACMYATSGSTGQPKPVLVTHDSLSERICAITEVYSISGTDRVAQLTSPAFDTMLWEVLPVLVRGGQLLIPAGPARVPGPELAVWLAQHRITAFTCTPTMLSALPFTDLPTLRLIVVGGEPLRPGPLDQWLSRYQVANAYGPTEATIEAIVAPQVHAGQQPVPIGRPYPAVHAQIVDSSSRVITQPGQVGELYLAGPGLALGYLDMPDETNAAFPELDLGDGQRRYFRTGDLVARLPDGQLTFIDRIDRQLNLGGIRLEPGEIEACAARHAGIRTAAVTADTRRDGHTVLTLHAATDGTVSESSLRRHLADHLIAVAVPYRIRLVDHLPRTQSGKVDHAALMSTPTDQVHPTPALPSRAAVPRQVARWWQDLTTTAGEPDFFRAGGTSMAAMRLVSLINQRFGTELTTADFVADPTLDHLVAVLAHSTAMNEGRP